MEASWFNLMERRKLLRTAGMSAAVAAAFSMKINGAKAATNPTDPDILNFALNLEYLEAEFYLRAVTGTGLAGHGVDLSGSGTGSGTQGTVTGGSKVQFQSRASYLLASEIARDEMDHVLLLRAALQEAGAYLVAEPTIDLVNSFTAAAQAAGLISAGQTFSPFDNENDFLLGAFIFEDVGVSAYAGAAPFITSKQYLSTAARILAVEAYHAGSIRTRLFLNGYSPQADKIAALRAKASGTGPGTSEPAPDDIGPTVLNVSEFADTDNQALAFVRTTGQVLSVAYLAQGTTGGGFFPNGVNGNINTAS